MKEYPFDLKEYIEHGLSPTKMSRNSKALERCVGLRPRMGQLVSGEAPFNPFDLTVSWPFPQMFKCSDKTILADQTAFYRVNHKNSWTKTLIGSGYSEGGMWHMADFGEFWTMFNGVSLVVYDSDGVTEYTQPKVQTGCNYRQRMILGGFDSGFWSSAWKSEIASWAGKSGAGLTFEYEMKSNMIFYGMIGGGDLKCWLTAPTAGSFAIAGPLGAGTGYDADRPFYHDLLRRGDIGTIPMPWYGTVLRVLPLGDFLVVYGTGGITVLNAVDTGFGIVSELSREVGLMGRGAVGGRAFGSKTDIHALVGDDGAIYVLTPDLKFERLNYAHHLTDLDESTIVSYDETWKEFYFSNDNRSFVLTPSGLGESHYSPTSLARYRDALIGPSVQPSECSGKVEVKTEAFRIGSPSLKKIQVVDVSYNKITNAEVGAEFRVNSEEDYRALSPRMVNPTGAAYIMTSGSDFKLTFSGDPVDDTASIDDIRCRWQVADNRNVRGAYNLGQTPS